MTTPSTATSVERRARPRTRAAPELLTFSSALVELLDVALAQIGRLTFPSARYRDDPVAFAREVLGIEPWKRQVEILELVRDNRRVAIKSGHRVGKSTTIAIIALWFYCSFEDARVVLSSTTGRQVDTILWREVKKLRARAGRCTRCKAEDPEARRIPPPCPHSTFIDPEIEIGERASTGLQSTDFREILGYTAKQSEAIAGVAGARLLFMIDEASGVPEFIYQAIAGNRAGNAKLALFGNPTRNSGEFYEAFHKKKDLGLYKTLTVSSFESPNVVAGHEVVPGLATLEWIEEMKIEYGEDSAFFKVRVLGEHAEHEEGKLFSLARIAESQTRWYETLESGRLYAGLDPAGPSGSGDDTALAPRRGLRNLALLTTRGLTEEGHLVWLLDALRKYRQPREVPVVVLDRSGSVGDKVYRELKAHAEKHRSGPDSFELVGLRMSDKALREPRIYHLVRDELAGNLDAWMRDGGAIVEDDKLAKELHTVELAATGIRGLMKVTPKDELRKELGRSPDRYDALTLSAWEPLSKRAGNDDDDDDDRDGDDDSGRQRFRGTLDPYAGR